MKEKIILFLKGMMIGMAMIIPGVSGGTLAISMGIYERLIKTISHFFKNFKENVMFLLPLGLGAVVSLGICSIALDYAFEKFPVATILFFIGLIIGSIPMLFEKVKVKETMHFTNVLLVLIGASVLIGISFLKSDTTNVVLGGFGLVQSIKLIGIGFVAAATLVIPGISGSFMLMVLGYYEPLLNVISQTVKFTNVWNNVLILIPFGIGVLLGGLVIVKIIEYLLNKFEIKTYYVIIGFLIASVLDVFLRIFNYSTNVVEVIIGIILFIAGSFLSLKVFKD